jgi:hypothetical protein
MTLPSVHSAFDGAEISEGNLLFGSLGRTCNPGRGQRLQAAELCGAA